MVTASGAGIVAMKLSLEQAVEWMTTIPVDAAVKRENEYRAAWRALRGEQDAIEKLIKELDANRPGIGQVTPLS
jgi:hypothetical protein